MAVARHCHGRAQRRSEPAVKRGTNVICWRWGAKYLPEHFSRPPSNMHRWLAGQLDAMRNARGTKLNVLGPRGGAKSTIGTLAFPLARGGRRPGTVYLDRFRHQASGLRTSGEHQGRTAGKRACWPKIIPKRPGGARSGGATAIVLRNGVTIEAFGTGPADSRPAAPRASADADRLRRPAKRRPYSSRPCSASIRAIGSTAR